jgi:hypothetical protein
VSPRKPYAYGMTYRIPKIEGYISAIKQVLRNAPVAIYAYLLW